MTHTDGQMQHQKVRDFPLLSLSFLSCFVFNSNQAMKYTRDLRSLHKMVRSEVGPTVINIHTIYNIYILYVCVYYIYIYICMQAGSRLTKTAG